MDFTAPISLFDCVSPIDYRYGDPDVTAILSENGYIQYACKVEVALAHALARHNICPRAAAEEIERACTGVTGAAVYAEEKRIGHDVRALVNVIRAGVSDETKPFVHMTATSFDVRDTANVLRVRDVTTKILDPALWEWMRTAIALTRREAATRQIG